MAGIIRILDIDSKGIAAADWPRFVGLSVNAGSGEEKEKYKAHKTR
jgi:hypothetical protein